MESVSIAAVESARAAIAEHVKPSPLIRIQPFGLSVKAENLQPVGSFKIRGAFNSALKVPAARRKSGLVAHSSGNHAQAVAYAGRALGIPTTIVMPETAPAFKVAATQRWGGEIIIHGRSSDDILDRARIIATEQGKAMVEPFDSPDVLAGTGTIALEILEDSPDVERIFVPVSGGGLIGGIAAAVKQRAPRVQVIGVEPALASDAFQSFSAGKVIGITPEDANRTIADGLRVLRLSELTWHHVRSYVDQIITVSESEIEEAMRFLAHRARLVAEPSGAVATAGVLAGGPLERSVAIVSGGNVDPALFARIVGQPPMQ